MKRIILLPVLLLLTIYADAQVWDWVETIRPGGNEYCWDVANDPQGNVLATGRVKAFSSFGSGAFVQTPPPKTTAETDVFVAKYRHNGDLVWVSRDGGAGADWGKCITSDLQSNVFVTGDYYDSARFGNQLVIPVGLGSSGMIRNIFIAKYDSSGVCLWAKSAGNVAAHSRGYGIVTDSAGNCYVVGHISGAGNFDGVTFGINGYNLPFIAKFSPAGTCIWAQSLSCQYGGECNDIKMDKDGNLLITGTYKGTIHCGPAAYTGTSSSWGDVFVAKINQAGTFIWSAVAKGAFQDQANAIDSDSDGNVYIVGTFANDLTFGVSPATVTINSVGTGATATAANSLADIFLAKYNSGGTFQWVKTIGNAVTPGTVPDPNDAWADDMVITKSNKIIIGGFLFGNSNMSGIPLALDTINHNAFITAFDQGGNVLWYKLHAGPGNNSIVRGLSADAHSNVYMGGEYSGTPYSSFDSVTVQSFNGYDGVIAKLTPPLDPLVAADTTSICPNNQVQFSIQQDGFPIAYQWSFPGGSPATSSSANPVISYPAGGTYDVSVIVANGHVTDTVLLSNYVHVNANTLAVDLGSDSLICEGSSLVLDAGSGYTSYLWNDSSIAQTLTVDSTGAYSVTVTNGSGCTGVDTIHIVTSICTDIADNSNSVNISIGPNPTSGYTQLNIRGIDFNLPVMFELYNSVGEKVRATEQVQKETTELNLSSVAPGIYFFRVLRDNKVLKFEKLVVLSNQ